MKTTINKKTHKIIAVTAACALSMAAFAACAPKKTNEKPEIVGANDFDCIVNESVDLLRKVSAFDKEDGDITPDMEISISPEVPVTDGVVVFDKVGYYTITYTVKDSDGNTAEAESEVSVIARDLFKSFDLVDMNGFAVNVSGDAKLETQSVVGDGDDSKMLFKVKGAKAAADCSLSRTYELEGGREYTFKYNVKSNVAGTVKAKVGSADAVDLAVVEGDNVLEFTHDLTAATGKKEVKAELLLGGLGDDIDWEFIRSFTEYEGEDSSLLREIEFTETTVEERFDGNGKNNGLDGSVDIAEDNSSATLKITSALENEGDRWQGGMFIETGVDLNPGLTYDISFNLKTKEDKPFDVCLLSSKWGPDEFIEAIPNLVANGKNERSLTVTDATKGTLVLYVRSGDQVNEITISELKVDPHCPQQVEFTDVTVKDRIDPGSTGIEGTAKPAQDKSSATLKITTAAESEGERWRGGMFVNTGMNLFAGKSYRVTFDLQTAEDKPFSVSLLRKQWGPGEFIGDLPDVVKNGKNEYTLTVTDATKGTLWLYISSGDQVNEITISNLKVEMLQTVSESYTCHNIYKMFAYEGAPNYVEWTDGKLVFNVKEFSDTDWHNKIEGPSFDMSTGNFGDFYISLKAKATAPVQLTWVGPKNGGWDPNVVWAKFNLSETETLFTFKSNALDTPESHHFEWQFGWTVNKEFKDVTIEISEITITYKSYVD